MKRKRICIVPQCLRQASAHGYCAAHWMRVRTTGSARPDVPIRERRTKDESKGLECNVIECDRAAHAKGYCSAHLHRQRRFGDPLAHIPIGDYSAWKHRG